MSDHANQIPIHMVCPYCKSPCDTTNPFGDYFTCSTQIFDKSTDPNFVRSPLCHEIELRQKAESEVEGYRKALVRETDQLKGMCRKSMLYRQQRDELMLIAEGFSDYAMHNQEKGKFDLLEKFSLLKRSILTELEYLPKP